MNQKLKTEAAALWAVLRSPGGGAVARWVNTCREHQVIHLVDHGFTRTRPAHV